MYYYKVIYPLKMYYYKVIYPVVLLEVTCIPDDDSGLLPTYSSSRTHVPLRPPRFSINRNSEITIPRSTPLHMS